MNNRINDKIEEIEKYISELESIQPASLEEYVKDIKSKAACERYAEKIGIALVDLAYLIIKERRLNIPENDSDTFNILFKDKLISQELCNRLQNAKGMRNILAHKYGEIDDEIVFNSINNELKDDAKEFIKAIKLLT